MTAPRIEVHEDSYALASAAAGELLSRLTEIQAAGGVPQLSLTGGSIAEAFHREVARLSPSSDVDWSRVVVWWGDDRFVAAESHERNAVDARRSFLDVVGAPADNVHEMPSTASAASVEEGAELYADLLGRHGAAEFDIVLLGVGGDGHVASLFPGSPQLDVRDRAVVGVTDSPKPPPNRISLTFPALNRARSVWFLVSGDAKAAAVASALADDADLHRTPAAGVSGSAETIWFLDRASASAL